MGTLTVTASGFSNLGSSAPSNWSTSSVTFPGTQSPNGTKTFTISDADWLSLLTWMSTQTAQISAVTGSSIQPLTPTAAQMLLAWLQVWVTGTQSAVQQFNTTAPVVPAKITIS